MIPVYKENFANLYEQKVKDSRHSNLLRRMGALEVSENSELVKIVNSELVKLMKIVKLVKIGKIVN